MWTAENRARYERRGLRCPTDLTDGEWALVTPHIRPAKRGGRCRNEGASDFTTQARAEAATGRFKQVIGDGLRSRAVKKHATEVEVAVHALNRILDLGRPNYARTA